MRIGDETLGERLARLRKERGITQVELAEMLGTSQPVVSDLEHDRLRPNVDFVVALAKAFKLSTDELLGIASEKKRSRRSKLDEQIEVIRGLPRRKKEFVVRMIDRVLEEAAPS